MKSTGISRPIDSLGRVVIPIELRRNLNLNTDDSVEIFVDGDSIVLKKLDSSCVFCGSNEDVVSLNGKSICKKCLEELKSL